MAHTSISGIAPSDGKLTHSRYPTWKNIIPLPPESLLWSVGGSTLELFLVLGDAWAQLISRYIPANARVLDIGCGCGRASRSLINHPLIRQYIGFDVIPANIEWCNHFITPAWNGRAEFYCYDLYSHEYNPNGSLQASELVFPAADGQLDVIFAVSLFTHLLEPDAVHYLQEISRTLSARGHALLSVHTNVPEGFRFFGTETRIDIHPEYFAELAANAGLTQVDYLDDLGGQQVFIFRKSS
jgi:SAM-dependent methyltransferase